MGNIVTGGSATVSVSASIQEYIANGWTGSGNPKTLTFETDIGAGVPPTDGSLVLALIVLNSSTGFHFVNGGFQRLAYWRDASVGVAQITDGEGTTFSVVIPGGWSFLADGGEG
jgi:hypothetical protein